MLNEFGNGIWTCDGGKIVAAMGFHYPLRMAVLRVGGGLMIWSPVPFSDALGAEIGALGRVDYIVAPNSLHHMSLPQWAAAYPSAKVVAAPGVAEKHPNLAFAATLGDAPEPDWADDLDQVLLVNRLLTEVVFFHKQSGTILFTDLLQHLPKGWFRGWRALVAHLDLMTGDEPQVPRKFRAGFSDRTAARAAMRRVLDWPADAVLMAHGAPVTEDTRRFLTRAFAWLKVQEPK